MFICAFNKSEIKFQSILCGEKSIQYNKYLMAAVKFSECIQNRLTAVNFVCWRLNLHAFQRKQKNMHHIFFLCRFHEHAEFLFTLLHLS